eukprot:2559584-Amphidinium_carterae.1
MSCIACLQDECLQRELKLELSNRAVALFLTEGAKSRRKELSWQQLRQLFSSLVFVAQDIYHIGDDGGHVFTLIRTNPHRLPVPKNRNTRLEWP